MVKINNIYGLYDSHVDFVTYQGINSLPLYGNEWFIILHIPYFNIF